MISVRRSIPIEGNLPPEPFIHSTAHGTVVFNFSHISDENTHPLVTELLISGPGVNVGNRNQLLKSRSVRYTYHNNSYHHW